MNRLFSGAIACIAIVAVACGGKPSVASRSAAAYRQAVAEGKDVGAEGHVHGGHAHDAGQTATATHDMSEMHPHAARESEHAGMEGMQHGAPKTMDHSQMQHGATGTMDHSQMQHGATGTMDHSQMQHGATGTMDHSQMQHGATGTMDHSQMQHGATIPSGGLWGAQPGSLPSGSPVDAAAPVSVQEARKSASDDMSRMDHAATSHSSEVVYTCPMHPEIVSSTPGTCPKCGMLLVRRGKQ